MSEMQRREIDVDGVTTRWLEVGDGFPVVLLHGIPTGPELWRHVAPLVSGRSLAWEMTGYASSIPFGVDRDISVAAQAGHLLRWLETVGIDRAVFVGHDLGGGVAQIAAVRAPERCAGLMLTNAICYDSWPIPSVKAMRSAGSLVARLPDPAFALMLKTFYRRGHDDAEAAAEAFRTYWPHYAAHGGAHAMVRQVSSLDVNDTMAIADHLPELRVPAQIVWGTGDQFQKVGYGERLAGDLGTNVRRIDGAKHWTPEDHPREVADAINDVVADAARG